jgi:acyl carrier protein
MNLIKSLFSEKENGVIGPGSDIKKLKEWSSLQNMIVVSEIDKAYDIIVTIEDFNTSDTLEILFTKIAARKK